MIRQQMGRKLEGANVDYFCQRVLECSHVKAPKGYWELRSQTVLTVERADGVTNDAMKQLDRAGLDRSPVANTLLDLFYEESLCSVLMPPLAPLYSGT